MAFAFTLLALLGLASCQTKPFQCGEVSETISRLTVQYTPSMPTQTPPISTVYGAMMTSYMNVVNCDYVMVENIDSNPPQVGEFTEKITVPVLTIYRVGCMPQTATISRRDFQIQDIVNPVPSRVALQAGAIDQNYHKFKRSEEAESARIEFIFDVADRLALGIDPTNTNITLRDFKFLVEINTALFALNVVNSGLPLTLMCQLSQNTTIQLDLEDIFINAKQASDIICFASIYGLFFNESNQELLAELASLEYAIQAHTYDTAALVQVCQDLDYSAASFLGIDTDGIRTYVCNSTGPPAHPTMSESSTITVSATGPVPTGFTGTSASAFSTTGAPSSNVSIVFGTSGSAFSSATSAASTVPFWWNFTTTPTSFPVSFTSGGHEVSPTSNSLTPHYYPPTLRRRVRGDF